MRSHEMFGTVSPIVFPQNSGPVQWARGDIGLKPSAAVRPSQLALLCLSLHLLRFQPQVCQLLFHCCR